MEKGLKNVIKKRIDLTSRHTCWGRGVRISESSQVSSGAPPKACSRNNCSSSRTLCSARAARMFSSFILSSTSARSFSQSSYKKSENWISWVQGKKPTKIQFFADKILGNWKPEKLNNRNRKCTNSILTTKRLWDSPHHYVQKSTTRITFSNPSWVVTPCSLSLSLT